MRIVFSKETVDRLVTALQKAYNKAGDAKMVKRVSALLELSRGEPVSEVSQTLDVSRTSIYEWLKAYLVEGEEGLRPE